MKSLTAGLTAFTWALTALTGLIVSCGDESSRSSIPAEIDVQGVAKSHGIALPAGSVVKAEVLLIAQGGDEGECRGETQYRAPFTTQVSAEGEISVSIPSSDFAPLSHIQCSLTALRDSRVRTLRLSAIAETSMGLMRANARSEGPEGENASLVSLHLDFDTLSTDLSNSGLPDLIVDADMAKASISVMHRNFAASSCAVNEGCLTGTGTRRLMAFDSAIANISSSPLVIGDATGAENGHYDACHNHTHVGSVMSYELVSQSGEVVVRGRKQGFCLMDSAQASGSEPGRFTCGFQGISPGWMDIYDRSLDCQWVDVTGVAAGSYLLRLTVNPELHFEESDYGNNTIEVPADLAPET